jgi:hypothetical protein
MDKALFSLQHFRVSGAQIEAVCGKKIRFNARANDFRKTKYTLGDSYAQLLHR